MSVTPPRPIANNKLPDFLRRITGLISVRPKAGEARVLLSMSWLRAFVGYCASKGTAPHPGKINNGDILDSIGNVRDDVQLFAISIPRTVWDLLDSHFGHLQNPIQRSLSGLPLQSATTPTSPQSARGRGRGRGQGQGLSGRSTRARGSSTRGRPAPPSSPSSPSSSRSSSPPPSPPLGSPPQPHGNLPPGLRRITNPGGTTCYMNGALQAINNDNDLVGYIRPLPNIPAGGIAQPFQNVINGLWSANQSPLDLNAFRTSLQGVIGLSNFDGSNQEDSAGFLGGLLDALHADLNTVIVPGPAEQPYLFTDGADGITQSNQAWQRFQNSNQSGIASIVMFQTRQTTRRACGHNTRLFGCDTILNLPARPTITECMNEYNAPTNHVHDMSDQSSGLDCPVCPQRVAGTIQHELGNLPTTLIISLTQQWENAATLKKTLVNFGVQGLQMTDCFGAIALYDLFAVTNHLGYDLNSGHYHTFAMRGGQWFHLNDDAPIVQVPHNKIVTRNAYILFYKKRPPSAASSTGGGDGGAGPSDGRGGGSGGAGPSDGRSGGSGDGGPSGGGSASIPKKRRASGDGGDGRERKK
ncbi:MAG: hypothetical protein J3Q66DRAFT_410907 [Benniella sp.]|nr:MAG: hypothetical protein J3Q66DRAFT_410907 [Benniella sp.]